jgi:hypothetical protein
VLAGFALSGVQTTAPPVPRVLFIGNSLTTSNDLPGLVASLARAARRPIECTSIAFPDHGLQEHWNRGEARQVIARGGWSHVVLQQGPSALPESRRLLRQYVRRFDNEIKRIGARTALYMVWPPAARSHDFDAVLASYTIAARDVDALLLPVGEAWRAAWRHDASLALYADDRFHPSVLGSYLGALVIYGRLTGRSAEGLPAIAPVTARSLEILLAAVKEVN